MHNYISAQEKMYLHNITLKAEAPIHAAWLKWIKTVYLPKMLSYNVFTEYELYRILHLDDTDGPTYALQLFTENKVLYDRFTELYETEIQEMQLQRWGAQVFSFSTLMETVH